MLETCWIMKCKAGFLEILRTSRGMCYVFVMYLMEVKYFLRVPDSCYLLRCRKNYIHMVFMANSGISIHTPYFFEFSLHHQAANLFCCPLKAWHIENRMFIAIFMREIQIFLILPKITLVFQKSLRTLVWHRKIS